MQIPIGTDTPASTPHSPNKVETEVFAPTLPRELSTPPIARAGTTYFALLGLLVLWAIKIYKTWGAWGNLTIDSGHEMYIPLLLAQGKQLYRDVWFMYGPASPYFNSYLYRMFGVHLAVLYWAGCLSALGSAIFLFLAGKRLSSPIIGWTAGAVVLMDAFQPSLFCFPLPYSFSTVYACLVGCIFLWVVIYASTASGWGWMLCAGTLAALEALLKPEFGLAAYCTLFPLVLVRGHSPLSWKRVVRDVLLLLPGIAVCVVVILWMVSIRGVEFITQENIVSWPTSYFMKNFGKSWLALNGFTITPAAFGEAAFRTFPLAGLALLAYVVLWSKRSGIFPTILKIALASVTVLYFAQRHYFSVRLPVAAEVLFTSIFFPQDMVLYVIIACAIVWSFFALGKQFGAFRGPEFPLLLTFSSLLAFRILMRMLPADYSIFYNGPVVLSFLLLVSMLIPRMGRSRRFVLLGEAFICLGCLIGVGLFTFRAESAANDYVPFTTERGTVRISRHLAENYTAAIAFMKQKSALGQTVMSVPEDTSLYFLSGTDSPTRVFSFTPGVLAPGKMTDETIQQIDRKPVQYLLWSNRVFPEFGVPVFGKDFDVDVGDYLRSHYRRVGPLLPYTGPCCDWTAAVWERNTDRGSN